MRVGVLRIKGTNMNAFKKLEWRVLTTFAILLISGLLYALSAINPSGYCSSQKRNISDEEFKQASLGLLEFERHQDQLLWNTDPKLYENYIKSYETLQKNRKSDGFIEVDRSNNYSIFNRVLGSQQIQVILNANSGDGQIRFYYDICGKLLHSEVGLRDTKYQTITTRDYPINN